MKMLTDDELRSASPEVRGWWQRVFELMNDSGCDLPTAITAIQASDQETHQ